MSAGCPSRGRTPPPSSPTLELSPSPSPSRLRRGQPATTACRPTCRGPASVGGRRAEPHPGVGHQVPGGHPAGGVGGVELHPHCRATGGQVQAPPGRRHPDAADGRLGAAGEVGGRIRRATSREARTMPSTRRSVRRGRPASLAATGEAIGQQVQERASLPHQDGSRGCRREPVAEHVEKTATPALAAASTAVESREPEVADVVTLEHHDGCDPRSRRRRPAGRAARVRCPRHAHWRRSRAGHRHRRQQVTPRRASPWAASSPATISAVGQGARSVRAQTR